MRNNFFKVLSFGKQPPGTVFSVSKYPCYSTDLAITISNIFCFWYNKNNTFSIDLSYYTTERKFYAITFSDCRNTVSDFLNTASDCCITASDSHNTVSDCHTTVSNCHTTASDFPNTSSDFRNTVPDYGNTLSAHQANFLAYFISLNYYCKNFNLNNNHLNKYINNQIQF